MRPTTSATPLVGRDAERDVVRARVGGLDGGIGGALLVTGEAGIGKSRLLGEVVAAAASAGYAVLTGRAVPGGGAYRPLAEALAGPLRAGPVLGAERLRPFRAALGRLVPGAGVDGTDAGHDAVGPDPAVVLGEGVLALLRELHGDRACVLVLDDLHWADPDTLDLLAYLAGAVSGPVTGAVAGPPSAPPVLLAMSARDDETSAASAGLAARPEVAVLALRRLDAEDVGRLVASRRGGMPPDDAELRGLVDRSDGLPFLVEELLDVGPLDDRRTVPPTWAALVARRLAALPARARAPLVAAAVAPGDPDHRLVGSATGSSGDDVLDALRAAADVGLLAPVHGRLVWRHALTRDAVLAALLPPERDAAADRVARALEGRDGPGDREAAADLHLAAGDPAHATVLLLGLARRDAARGALRHAEALLARAAATGCAPGPVATERVRVLTLLGRVGDALAVGDGALGSGRVTGDEHAELCLALARTAIAGGRWTEAEDRVARAGRPGDARSLVLAADAAYGAGDTPRAARRARAAVDLAEPAVAAGRPDAAGTLCEALLVLGRCASGDRTAARDLTARAAQVAAEHALTPWRVEALFGLGAFQFSSGDPHAPALGLARDLAEQHGMVARAAQADLLLADAALHVDGPRAALAIITPAVERLGRLRVTALQGMSELIAAAATALAGDTAGAQRLAAAAATRAHVPVEVTALGPLVQALPLLLDHDLPRATALADRGITALLDHRSGAPISYYGLWVLLRTVVADRDDRARAVLRHHHVTGALTNAAALTYADAVAAGRAGRPGEAAARFAEADAALAALPWWNRLLHVLVLEAAVRDGWGDPVPALRADLTAHEQAADDGDAGARALARTCTDLLRVAGAPTRRARSGAPVPPPLRRLGVTGREAEVLGLVADHLTNGDIAARLHLSERTVESHVARLLAKTGTTSRAELRAWADTEVGAAGRR